MEQIVWEKVAENLDFVEDNNFIRENTETAVRGCSSVNINEITRSGVLL